MSTRLLSTTPQGFRPIDLREIDCDGTRCCIRDLARAGLGDHAVAQLVGWNLNDVRRALALDATGSGNQ